MNDSDLAALFTSLDRGEDGKHKSCFFSLQMFSSQSPFRWKYVICFICLLTDANVFFPSFFPLIVFANLLPFAFRCFFRCPCFLMLCKIVLLVLHLNVLLKLSHWSVASLFTGLAPINVQHAIQTNGTKRLVRKNQIKSRIGIFQVFSVFELEL